MRVIDAQHPRRHRVPRPHRLRQRVGAQHDADPAQLDLDAISRTGSATTTACSASTSPSTTTAPPASGKIDGFEDRYYYGRKPAGVHPRQLPQPRKAGDGFRRRLHHVHRRVPRARRADGRTRRRRVQGRAGASRGRGGSTCTCRARRSPRKRTTSACTRRKKDQWGIPLLVTSVGYDDNDERMIRDWRTQATEMLEVAGCRDIETRRQQLVPGLRHPRDGRLPHGQRSEDLAAQRVEPAARRAPTSSSPTAPA